MIFFCKISIVFSCIPVILCFNTSSWGPENKEELDQLILQCEDEKTLIENVAFKGDKETEYRISLRDLNLEMRENYDEMIKNVGHNIYPLIIVNDAHRNKELSGIGSEYTLYLRNGTVKSMKPTPVEYETNKDLAHVPMGIFSIISQYFLTNSTNWKQKLASYKNSLEYSLHNLQNIKNLTYTKLCENNLVKEDQEKMLTLAVNFINKCFVNNAATVQDFYTFSQNYLPYTKKALKCAVEAQTKAALPFLQIWKNELGTEWDNLYVIIPVIWPVSRINPRQLIFERLMNPKKIKTHILKAENIISYADTISLLGRIVTDRTMSHYVFGHKSNHSMDMHMALSTRRDLTATSAQNLNLTQEIHTDDVESNKIRYKDV